MKIKIRQVDGEEKCPECNWSATKLISIGDNKGELCPDCFVDWLQNNNKEIKD